MKSSGEEVAPEGSAVCRQRPVPIVGRFRAPLRPGGWPGERSSQIARPHLSHQVFAKAVVVVLLHQLKTLGNALHWHAVSDIKTMAFDHQMILDTCVAALQRKIQEEPIIFNLLEEKFSLRDLQQLFEQILGVAFDRRNFRKKFG